MNVPGSAKGRPAGFGPGVRFLSGNQHGLHPWQRRCRCGCLVQIVADEGRHVWETIEPCTIHAGGAHQPERCPCGWRDEGCGWGYADASNCPRWQKGAGEEANAGGAHQPGEEQTSDEDGFDPLGGDGDEGGAHQPGGEQA